MEGTIAVITGAVLLAMTAACGDADDPGGSGPYRNATSDERVHMSLDRPSELRSSAILDDPTPDGDSSPASVALPVKQLKHEFGYDLGPPGGTAPAITQAEAIEAAHRFGFSKDAQLRAAAVRSGYAPDYGPTFDHNDLWVLAFDVMVSKWGALPPPGLNKPNPLVPGTAVVFVNPETAKTNRALFW